MHITRVFSFCNSYLVSSIRTSVNGISTGSGCLEMKTEKTPFTQQIGHHTQVTRYDNNNKTMETVGIRIRPSPAGRIILLLIDIAHCYIILLSEIKKILVDTFNPLTPSPRVRHLYFRSTVNRPCHSVDANNSIPFDLI